MVLRPSLKRVVPGSVPPWRAPCFAWPCRGFGLPGVFSWLRRGFLLPARDRGAASEIASGPAIARLFPYYSSCYKNLLLKLFPASRDKQLRPTARGFSSMFKSLGLSARLRAARRRSLMSAQLVAFAFPLARNLVACRLFLIARCLLPATRAHGCSCSQPFSSRRAWLFLPHGFHRAPPNLVFEVAPATC